MSHAPRRVEVEHDSVWHGRFRGTCVLGPPLVRVRLPGHGRRGVPVGHEPASSWSVAVPTAFPRIPRGSRGRRRGGDPVGLRWVGVHGSPRASGATLAVRRPQRPVARRGVVVGQGDQQHHLAAAVAEPEPTALVCGHAGKAGHRQPFVEARHPRKGFCPCHRPQATRGCAPVPRVPPLPSVTGGKRSRPPRSPVRVESRTRRRAVRQTGRARRRPGDRGRRRPADQRRAENGSGRLPCVIRRCRQAARRWGRCYHPGEAVRAAPSRPVASRC